MLNTNLKPPYATALVRWCERETQQWVSLLDCEQRIADMKTAMNRPNLEGKHNGRTCEKSAYDQAFDLYLRKGIEPRLEQKGLSDLNSNDFGYAIDLFGNKKNQTSLIN